MRDTRTFNSYLNRQGLDQEGAYEKWRKALRLPTVQGLVVGRSLLYPSQGSVETAVDTAVGLL